MDEEDMIRRIEEAWPRGDGQPGRTLIALVEKAVSRFPSSSEVWLLYGQLLLDWDDNPTYSTEETIKVFRRVIELNPGCWKAYEEIGFLYDTYLDEFDAAEVAFRNAIALGGEENCFFGLARVLAQLGRKAEALSLLSPKECPFADRKSIAEMRDEIQRDLWNRLGE